MIKESDVRNRKLKKALKEYYKWHGESKAVPVRLVKNKNSDFSLLLVRFTGEDGRELSSLVYHDKWKDGHFEVEEMEAAFREDEDEMVQAFEESDQYI